MNNSVLSWLKKLAADRDVSRFAKIRRQTVPGHWIRDGEAARPIAGQTSPWNDDIHSERQNANEYGRMSPTLGCTCRPGSTAPHGAGTCWATKQSNKERYRISEVKTRRFRLLHNASRGGCGTATRLRVIYTQGSCYGCQGKLVLMRLIFHTDNFGFWSRSLVLSSIVIRIYAEISSAFWMHEVNNRSAVCHVYFWKTYSSVVAYIMSSRLQKNFATILVTQNPIPINLWPIAFTEADWCHVVATDNIPCLLVKPQCLIVAIAVPRGVARKKNCRRVLRDFSRAVVIRKPESFSERYWIASRRTDTTPVWHVDQSECYGDDHTHCLPQLPHSPPLA